MEAAHVVCKECGARWTSVRTALQCKTPDCEAGWLDLPMFADKADADRAAERFKRERVAAVREP